MSTVEAATDREPEPPPLLEARPLLRGPGRRGAQRTRLCLRTARAEPPDPNSDFLSFQIWPMN